jgi:LysM repeat protein
MSDYNLIEYTTQPGDTLWDLAYEYGTTVEEIMDCNSDLDPDNLQIGQVIGIPDYYDTEQWPPRPWRPWYPWGRPWRDYYWRRRRPGWRGPWRGERPRRGPGRAPGRG